MTVTVAPERPVRTAAGDPPQLLAAIGLLVLVLALLPPLGVEVRRSSWAEALQFGLLAFGVPPLVTLGAPWRRSRAARAAASRRRRGRIWRAVPWLAAFLAAVIAWRVPAAVDAVAASPPLALAEAASFLVPGVLLWRELVPSPPYVPSIWRPERMLVAALAMWGTWIVAYVLGFSHVSWFHAYRHVAGRGLSLIADQSLTTGIMWASAGAAFAPVVFVNLVRWLAHDDDPDEELARLVRQETRRRRSWGKGWPGTAGTARRP